MNFKIKNRLMKFALTLLLFLLINIAHAQCYELLKKTLDSTKKTQLGLVEKLELHLQSGKTTVISLRGVKHKSRYTLLFQEENLTDSIDVTLLTINRKTINRKIITKSDHILRCRSFLKSGKYFLVITTRKKIDQFGKPLEGCLGIAILERVRNTSFRKPYRIKWVVENR